MCLSTYSTWTPTTISFSFLVSLIVEKFIIFGSFLGPQLLEPFSGPKKHFSGKREKIHYWLMFSIKICIPWIYLSKEVLCASNIDCIPKIRPREVDVPIYPNGANSVGTSFPRVRFLNV